MIYQVDTSSVILAVKDGLNESTYLFVIIAILLAMFILMRTLGKKKKRSTSYRMDMRKKMEERKK